jgi:hypothetical protein
MLHDQKSLSLISVSRTLTTERQSKPISRVLSSCEEDGAAIPLGNTLLHCSSRLPANYASRVIVCLFGVAPGGGYRVSPAFLRKRLVSVALFLALVAAMPSTYGGRALPDTLLCGARTFLPFHEKRAAA